MKVLLDRCVPFTLKPHFAGHECIHASEEPWGEATNGRLVRFATEAGYDVLFNVDRNMPHQTLLTPGHLPVVLAVVRANRLPEILPSMPRILQALQIAPRGTYIVVPFLQEDPSV